MSYPYKQYYAPWFLFGSIFVVVLGQAIEAWRRPLGTAVFVLASIASIAGSLWIGGLWHRYSAAPIQCATLRALNLLALPGDRVVAPPPDHPIARQDAFFLWFNTSDPDGYDSERILEALPRFRPLVGVDRNAAALAEHPPAFVVLDSGPFAAAYPRGQWEALLGFLPRHGYRTVRLGSLRLAVRPDRYEALRGEGLFRDAGGPLGPLMPAYH